MTSMAKDEVDIDQMKVGWARHEPGQGMRVTTWNGIDGEWHL